MRSTGAGFGKLWFEPDGFALGPDSLLKLDLLLKSDAGVELS